MMNTTKENVYETPITNVIPIQNESAILNGTNTVVGPEPEYPD